MDDREMLMTASFYLRRGTLYLIILSAFIVAALSIRGTTPAYAEILYVGQHGRIDPEGLKKKRSEGWYGCREYNALAKFDRLLKEDDAEAALTLAQQQCLRLPAGTDVVIEDATFLHGALCARPLGKPDCLWIDEVWVTKTK